MRRAIAVSGMCAALALAGTAEAESFRTRYDVPHECPDRSAFVRAVEQRLSGWAHLDDPHAPADRELNVVIRRTADGYHALLLISDGQGSRELEGKACDSLVRALSIVTAVSLDPSAALSIEDSEPVAIEEPPETSEPAPLVVPPVAPTASERAAPIVDRPRARERAASSNVNLAIGVGGALMLGPAPGPLYGAEGHAELGIAERTFSIRLAGAYLSTGSVDAGSAPVRFELLHGEIAGCYRPLRERVSAMGCAVFDAGRMQASGEQSPALAETKHAERLWLAAGARLGLAVGLVEPLELGASAGLLIPLARHTYVFENPTESVHESSLVALDLRLGLSVRLF